jgi:curli biogenesis system outer membrane secretion channel CsgG
MRFGAAFLGTALAFCLLLPHCSACPQEITKKRVAILNFEDYSAPGSGSPSVFGAVAQDVGKGVSAQLIEKLTAGGKYTVVDRSALKTLLDEQAASEPDGMDGYGRAARIGRLLALDAMIVGAITRFGPDVPQKSGSTHPRMSRRKSKAYVDITARVLDMSTAEVIAAFTITGESAHTGEVMIIGTGGKSAATQEVLDSEFAETLLGEATRNAVEKLAAQLNAFAEKIPVLTIDIDGLVAEVAGNSMTLNVGKKSGVKLGDKLTVLREAPASREAQAGPLALVVQHIGQATVTEVADLYSTAIIVGSAPVQVGDRVKRVASPQTRPIEYGIPRNSMSRLDVNPAVCSRSI